MSNKETIIFIFWVATFLFVAGWRLYGIIKNKEGLTLGEILGGALTLAFFVPAFWVMGIMFLLDSFTIQKAKENV